MGDDYGWLAVRMDVDRFVKDKNLELNMFGVYYNWFSGSDRYIDSRSNSCPAVSIILKTFFEVRDVAGNA